jgi:predicted HicB family RNase H-like nuclease
MMAVSEKQLEYANKYFKKFDDIKVRVQKGKREEYKTFAESHGGSLNQFIIDAIDEKISRS